MPSTKKMWFGTVSGVEAKLQWVPLPATGMAANRQGWSEKVTFENGGSNVARSFGFHRVYEMDFPIQENLDLDVFADYASGLYGDGMLYFADEMTWDQNLLPAQWAAPSLCANNAWPHIGTYMDFANTAANVYKQPAITHRYKITGASYVVPTDPAQSVVVPIPPTHALWWGWSGSRTGSGVLTMAAHRISDGATIYFDQTPLTATASTRLSGTSISGATYDWARLFINRTVAGTDIISGSSPTYTGTAITNGRQIPAYAIANPSYVVYGGGADIPNGVSRTPVTTPTGMTSLNGTVSTAILTADATRVSVFGQQFATTTTVAADYTMDPATSVVTAQSAAFRGTISVIGTSTSGVQANSSRVTIPVPTAAGALVNNDVLVAVIRGSSSTSATDWASAGWTRVGAAFVPNSSSRVQGIYVHVVTDATQEPLSYTFQYGGTGRAAAVMLNLRGVNLDVSYVSPTSAQAQLWPIGVTPTLTGSFIPGKGNSGCRFDGEVMPQNYVIRDAGRNVHYVGLSATLSETGAWENA